MKQGHKMTNDAARLEAAWEGKIPDNTPDKKISATSND